MDTPASSVSDENWEPVSRSSTAALSEPVDVWQKGDRAQIRVRADSDALVALHASNLTKPCTVTAIRPKAGDRFDVHLAYDDGSGFVSCSMLSNGEIDVVWSNDDEWTYYRLDNGRWSATRARFLQEFDTVVRSSRDVESIQLLRVA